MARLNLRCTCGFFFSIPSAMAEGPVKCPSCLKRVSVAGPQPDRVEAPPEPLSRKLDQTVSVSARTLGMIAGAAAVLVVGVIVLIWTLSGSDEEDLRKGGSEREGRTGPVAIRNDASAPPASRPPVPEAARPPAGTAPKAPPPAPAAQAPSVAPSPIPDSKPVAPTSPGHPSLPLELVARAKEALSLPPFYRNAVLPPEERGRADSILSSGRGAPEDAIYLQGLLDSARLKAVQVEHAYIRDSLGQLERESLESLPVDSVAMRDGRLLSGRVQEETPEMVRLHRKLAGQAAGIMNLKRADIKEIQKGKGIGAEFLSKWKSASQAKPAEQLALLGWCKDNSLPAEARLVAFRILKEDPGNAVAREEVALPGDPVRASVEAAAQGGAIFYQGRNWVPSELKEKLTRDGFVALGGQWYTKRERQISVPSLFRYDKQKEKPVNISSSTAPINHDVEMIWRTEKDGEGVREVGEPKYLRRFYAPTLGVTSVKDPIRGSGSPTKIVEVRVDRTEPPAGKPLTGEVSISVPLGQPVLEAWVTTLAETKQDGTVTLFLVVNYERHKLYQCAAREEAPHKLPEVVRGQTAVELVAVLSMPAVYTARIENRQVCPLKESLSAKLRTVIQREVAVVHERQLPEYRAVLFPSTSTTAQVFLLKAIVGEPAPALTRLFADVGATEMLK